MFSLDSFPKIDAHIHFNSDRRDLLGLAEKYNFSLLTINTEVPDFPSIEKQKDLARKYQKYSTGNLFYATTISSKNIFQPAWAEKALGQLEQDISQGACGVKFWKNIGMSIQRNDGTFVMPDEAELKPVFDYLEEQQITALGHQGEPKNCWLPLKQMTVRSDREYFAQHPRYHMYLHKECPDYWEHIEARDRILERHADLPFVGLHLASLEWNLDELSDRLEKYPCLAVDLAERIAHLYYHTIRNRDHVIDFFKKYQDRIIYGTDIIDDPRQDPIEVTRKLEYLWKEHWLFFATDKPLSTPQIEESFRGLALPESILEKLYRANAMQWYQL